MRHLIQRYGRDLDLTVVTRRKDASEDIHPLARPFVWDITASAPPARLLTGCDVVINLTGETIARRWTKGVKERIRDSRVLSTRNLADAIGGADPRPKILVNASATGYYGARGEEELTEHSAPGQDFLARVCVTWEEEALRAREMGLRVVVARFGVVFGYDGGALERILPFFEWGVGGALGSGRQWSPWIHIKDAVGAIRHSIEDDRVNGPVNIVSPQPVRNRDLTKALARVVGKPAIFPVPSFVLMVWYGEMASVLLSSQKVMPSVLTETGFHYEHPELTEALAHILYWRKEMEKRRPIDELVKKGLPFVAQK